LIPGNAPPTLECLKGNVTWRLNGQVRRPGAFTHKLSASREVILVTSTGEDDTEDTENIIVRRQWDSQLQYFLSISGRSFYIGGTLPIQITILPMAKIKVHGVSVILEGTCYALCIRHDSFLTCLPLERTDYYSTATDSKRIARTDPIQRFSLLSLKSSSQESKPILPIISDDPEAFKHSPFFAPEGDPSGVPSSLMGPGPWIFQRELALPTSCTQVHFSNKNRRANILITHTLKVVFRVERGDDKYVDQKTGNRKLFDIIMGTPVNILSVSIAIKPLCRPNHPDAFPLCQCRCTPEWTSLPCYNKFTYDDSAATSLSCPCIIKNIPSVQTPELLACGLYGGLDCIPSQQSTESVSTAENSSIDSVSLRRGDSLYDLNTQFERLVSGQESEFGEAPPAYYAAVW
jgi:arrestin-related trafficking adapter 3/6